MAMAHDALPVNLCHICVNSNLWQEGLKVVVVVCQQMVPLGGVVFANLQKYPFHMIPIQLYPTRAKWGKNVGNGHNDSRSRMYLAALEAFLPLKRA